ncbi:MAG: histidine phosphatase family protein [Ferruginibacter sp.]
MKKILLFKKHILFICLMCFYFFATAQNAITTRPGSYYIVRHAEKDTGNNPVLIPAGLLRAGDLYRALKNRHIDKIYTTKYRRTKMTADSLSIYSGISVVEYIADTTGSGLQEKINEQKDKQKNILIIAHSNTIPVIIKMLGISNFRLKEIPDNEFDNLYIITKKNNSTTIQYKKYGTPSNKMKEGHKMNPLQ